MPVILEGVAEEDPLTFIYISCENKQAMCMDADIRKIKYVQNLSLTP